MKINLKIGSLVALLFMCATVTHGTQLAISSANALGGGDTFTDGATVAYAPVGENGLSVSFGVGAYPAAPILATVLVDDGVPGSAFFGNYVSRAINTIALGITGSGNKPYTATLLICSAVGSQRIWRFNMTSQISAVAGERVFVQAPLKAALWRTNWPVTSKDAAFAEDLQHVGKVYITLKPGAVDETTPTQSYIIDGVVLVNDDGISSPPGALTPLEKGLTARFGYGYGSVGNLTDAMKLWDKDGDGMCDYAEIWSENDEDYANSIFAAENIQVVEDGVDIEWTCVVGKSYTVLRAGWLGDGFVALPELIGIVATNTGYMTRRDENAAGQAGPFYYRIRKD